MTYNVETNIISFVKVLYVVFRRLCDGKHLLGEDKRQTPKRGAPKHCHNIRCVKSGAILIACYELAIFVRSGTSRSPNSHDTFSIGREASIFRAFI